MIKEESSRFSLRLMCRLLSVSVSGYYNWRARIPSRREEENQQLANKIKTIFDEEKSRAGSLRVTKRLNIEGTPVGRGARRKPQKFQDEFLRFTPFIVKFLALITLNLPRLKNFWFLILGTMTSHSFQATICIKAT